MANITAAMVKELRDLTGAGMLDCKKALTECDGDIDKAVDYLREKGQAKAVKKAGRIAAEGIVKAAVKGNQAVIVEVNSETDFVAKNEKFQAYVDQIIETVFANDVADVDALMATPWIADPSITVKDAHVNMVATIGENLTVRRFEKITTDGIIVPYIHGGGRIGVLVESECDNNDGNNEALKNIAMQIAALNPQYITRDEISADELSKLRKITIDSAINEPDTLPKPILTDLLEKAVNANVWSDADKAAYEEQKNNLNYLFNFLSAEAKTAVAAIGMANKDAIVENKIFNGLVEGRVSKQVKEIVLTEQTYVKAEDGKQTVAAYLKSVGISVKKFVRYETGEGIEKKQEDFAAEVAAQMNA